MQKRREKLALRQARREEKAESSAEEVATEQVDDPMQDPSIDWGDAVREVKLEPEGEDVEPDPRDRWEDAEPYNPSQLAK